MEAKPAKSFPENLDARIVEACERTGISTVTKEGKQWMGYTPLHCLYAEFKKNHCGHNLCIQEKWHPHGDYSDNYYLMRCISALCFVQWLASEGIVDFKIPDIAAAYNSVKVHPAGEGLGDWKGSETRVTVEVDRECIGTVGCESKSAALRCVAKQSCESGGLLVNTSKKQGDRE